MARRADPTTSLVSLLATDTETCASAELTAALGSTKHIRDWLDSFEAGCINRVAALDDSPQRVDPESTGGSSVPGVV